MTDRILELWDALPLWFLVAGFLLMLLGMLIGATWAGLCQRNDAADRLVADRFAAERIPTDELGFPCDPEDAVVRPDDPVPFRVVDADDPIPFVFIDKDAIVDTGDEDLDWIMVDPADLQYLEPEARPWGERIDPNPATFA